MFLLKGILCIFADIHNGAHIHFIRSVSMAVVFLASTSRRLTVFTQVAHLFRPVFPGKQRCTWFSARLINGFQNILFEDFTIRPEGAEFVPRQLFSAMIAAATGVAFTAETGSDWRRFLLGRGYRFFLPVEQVCWIFRLSRIVSIPHHISNGQRIAFFGNLPERSGLSA